MPIYEYSCESCGHQLEALQKMSDAPLQECPECHQASLTKLVSAVAFRLKGGGWYETDFKAGDKKNLVDEGKSDKDKPKDAKGDTDKVTKTDDKKSTKDTVADKKTTETKSTSQVSSTKTESSST